MFCGTAMEYGFTCVLHRAFLLNPVPDQAVTRALRTEVASKQNSPA